MSICSKARQLLLACLLLLPIAASFAAPLATPWEGTDWDQVVKEKEGRNANGGYGLLDKATIAYSNTLGKTPDQMMNNKQLMDQAYQQYTAALEDRYNSVMGSLDKATNYLQDIDQKTANGQRIDWSAIAADMGMNPGLSPDEIKERLQVLDDYKKSILANLAEAQAHGLTLAEYMYFLTGRTESYNSDGNVVACGGYDWNNHGLVSNGINLGDFWGTSNASCWNDVLNDVSNLLRAPPTREMPDQGIIPDNSSTATSFWGHIREQIPSIIRLIFALCYTIGTILVVKGFLKLKEYGQNLRNAAYDNALLGVIAYVVAGSALIYIPSTIHMSTATIFALGGDSSLFSYGDGSVHNNWDDLLAAIIDIVKLVGLIAFIRGWLLISKVGHQAQHGLIGKGLLHIVCGIIAVNIISFWEMIRATLSYVV